MFPPKFALNHLNKYWNIFMLLEILHLHVFLFIEYICLL